MGAPILGGWVETGQACWLAATKKPPLGDLLERRWVGIIRLASVDDRHLPIAASLERGSSDSSGLPLPIFINSDK